MRTAQVSYQASAIETTPLSPRYWAGAGGTHLERGTLEKNIDTPQQLVDQNDLVTVAVAAAGYTGDRWRCQEESR